MLEYKCARTFYTTIVVYLLVVGFTSRTLGLDESTDWGGSNAKAVHQLGYSGQGVNIGFIAGKNIRDTHHAFFNKDINGDPTGPTHAHNYDFSGDGINLGDHDMQLSGIVISRGDTTHPYDTGAAPGADLYCGRVADDAGYIYYTRLRDGLIELITQQNCRVMVTGFSLSGDSNGLSDWTLLYDYFAYEYDVLFANAAGNSNTRIDIFGDGYNGITTGGLILNDINNEYIYRKVGSWSGAGPTQDGRRKPEVVSPSQNQTVPTYTGDTSWITVSGSVGQTSWAVPQLAGVVAVLISVADQTATNDDNQNEVIKAVVVNSAFPNVNDKSGNQTNPADISNTWHYQRGYGRIDALRAYELIDANQITPGSYITEPMGWAYESLSQGQMDEYTISAEAGQRLVATLTWDRRIEWVDSRNPTKNGKIDTGELHPYLADLDLVIYAPDGTTEIFSENLLGLYAGDNLEKCDLMLTETGDYIIDIVNDSTNDEGAAYGFAFELLDPMPADFNEPDYIVDYNDLEVVSEEWLSTDPNLEADLFEDGIVDFRDFATFCQYWLEIDLTYYQEP